MIFENDLRSRAEQMVLAALLRDSGCMRHIEDLKPCDFSHGTHGEIFRTIVKLHALALPVDVAGVYASMQRHRNLPSAYLHTYLDALRSLYTVPAHVGYYAATMRSHPARVQQ